MRCEMTESGPALAVSNQERRALERAFEIVEQGAYHLRRSPENHWEGAADCLEAVLGELREEPDDQMREILDACDSPGGDADGEKGGDVDG